jgi:hypothetical protein
MLAVTRISDAVMVDVAFLHFGKLVSRNSLVRAPEGMGVTSRSEGLTAEDDGDLRLNTLLETQVFSPAMIDAKMADAGLLLVRTIAPTQRVAYARTVFVRARFRQESDGSSDSRVHQQAAIWVVKSDLWCQHPAAILAKVGVDLVAEPDYVDDPKRFDAPRKLVALDNPILGANPGNPKANDAFWRILDVLLPERFGERRSKDRSVTFGHDVFNNEPEFLTTVGRALQALPRTGKHFPHWNDISIGSGLRQPRGGLLIRYLKSEKTPEDGLISSEDERNNLITSIRSRIRLVGGTLEEAADQRPQRPKAAGVVLSSLARPKPDAAAYGNQPRPAAASPAASVRSREASTPAEATQTFRSRLKTYRDIKDERAAQALIDAADSVRLSGGLRQMVGHDRSACEGVLAAGGRPQPNLPLGALYDRALLLSRLPNASTAGAWFEALTEAIFKAGVLLGPELDRFLKVPSIFGEKSREAMQNSRELAAWLKELRSDPNSETFPTNLHFLKKLRTRLNDMSAARSRTDDHGIHQDVMIQTNMMLGSSDLPAVQDQLLHSMAANLYTTLFHYHVIASNDPNASVDAQRL